MGLLMLLVTALLIVFIFKMTFAVGPADRRSSSDYGVFETHAPQIVGLLLGLILAILTRVGVSLTDTELSLLTSSLTVIVPLLLSWLAGKFTEQFTYSKRTADRLSGQNRRL